jgi:hypothetical protein
MLRHSGIELEGLLRYSLEQNQEPQIMIDEYLRYFERSHLELDMSAQGLFISARTPRESFYKLQEE